MLVGHLQSFRQVVCGPKDSKWHSLTTHASVAPARVGTVIYIQGDERGAKDPLVLPKTASGELSNNSVVVNGQRECFSQFLTGKW
jgi:hypothetical protein